MSDDKIENPVSYSQLQDLEDDFEDVELELRKFFSHLSQFSGIPLPGPIDVGIGRIERKKKK